MSGASLWAGMLAVEVMWMAVCQGSGMKMREMLCLTEIRQLMECYQLE